MAKLGLVCIMRYNIVVYLEDLLIDLSRLRVPRHATLKLVR